MFLFLSSLALSKNIIIIDAGSTGSRLYIYTYDDIYNLSSYDQMRDSEGKPVSIKSSLQLSETLNNESKLVEYFDILLDKGSHNYIEKTMRSTTPLYLFASGGLNYIESEKARQTLMNDAFQYVNQKYRYLVKDNYFQVVTGKEEAEFAWIAANHFLGGFESNKPMAVAEIGGTHAQIAFSVSNPSSIAKPYVESISVNRKKYKVFRNSWNNFGDVDVEKSILQYLKDQNKAESPCHLIGTPDIGQGFGLNTTFTGKPNFDKCIELISTVQQKSSNNKCDSDPCLFMDKDDNNEDVCVPYAGGLTYAVVYGMIAYNLEFLKYPIEIPFSQYIADTYVFGNKTYEEAKALDPSYGYTSKIYFQMCLTNSFLNRGTNGEIQTLRRVNSTRWAGLKLDWTMGAAIYLTSASVYRGMPVHFIIIIVGLTLCCIVMVFLAIKCIIDKMKEKRKRLNDTELNVDT